MAKEIELSISLSDVMDRIEDDDLVEEIKRRDLEDEFNNTDEDKIRKEEYKNLKENNFVLPKFFDRHQLRDHLLDIAQLGSYASDKSLFNKLSDLLEFS